jgi:polysaccharide export outer membrane protein
MKRILVLAAILLAADRATPVYAQALASAQTMLHPGDAVKITVWRQPELSGEFSIAEDGSIIHPLLREVTVTGIPMADAEARVRDYLDRLQANPQFVVQPLLRVSVGGEVRQPSLYRLPPETSIAEAVALAGGATDQGRLNRIRLFRGGREIVVDLTSPEAGLAQAPIQSGDQIFVDRKVNVFREYIAPASGLTAAFVSFLGILLR